MENVKKLSEDALEDVVGGKSYTVHNTKTNHISMYKYPGSNSKVLSKLSNGQKLFKTGNTITMDGVTWCEVQIPFQAETGWVKINYLYDNLD